MTSGLIACDDGTGSEQDGEVLSIGGTEMAGSEMAGTGLSGTEIAGTEIMMLANVPKEYVFKTIDPAIVPENKSEPRRALIFVLGTLFGGLTAVIYVLYSHYIRPINSKK